MHYRIHLKIVKKKYVIHFINIFIVSASLFLSTLCLAKTDTTHEQLELESTLRSLMPTKCVFSTQFTQVKKTSLFTLTSSGTLFYSCDYGLLWKSTTPFIETLIYKKNTLNFRIEEDNTRERLTSMAHRNLGKFLLHLLDGDVTYFFDAFDVTFNVKTETNNHSGLLLTPKSKFMKKAIQSISLTMLPDPEPVTNTKPLLRLGIRINHANEDITDITIDNIITFQPENDTQLDIFCTKTVGKNNDACKTLKLKKKVQNIK